LCITTPRAPRTTNPPYTTLFRSAAGEVELEPEADDREHPEEPQRGGDDLLVLLDAVPGQPAVVGVVQLQHEQPAEHQADRHLDVGEAAGQGGRGEHRLLQAEAGHLRAEHRQAHHDEVAGPEPAQVAGEVVPSPGSRNPLRHTVREVVGDHEEWSALSARQDRCHRPGAHGAPPRLRLRRHVFPSRRWTLPFLYLPQSIGLPMIWLGFSACEFSCPDPWGRAGIAERSRFGAYGPGTQVEVAGSAQAQIVVP